MSNRAVGYTRLSQEGGASIPRQKRRIREYADDHDAELVRIYDDGQHTSGFESERGEYQQLLADAEAGNFDMVIVDDGSRLGRETKERIRAFYDLDDYGVEFHAAQYGYVDPDEPMDVLMEVFRATTDERAKKAEIEKAREAVEHRLEQGYDHGRPPFGFKFDDEGHYWVPDDEFETALEVIELREEGMSFAQIESETGVSRATASRIVDREERYFDEA